ncbi:hypothetical protein L210DRAFT_3642683 [Boletus edulis BED1]|uniref:RING-type domain-containing protein n=1 Tax=Boletus edulis BED1 TaxID=1328754 RepID=A0AAD4BZD1_BOLED|nr:hypothetical protein L210DRAFT_3642683 [Boletus edulis BED1]
MLVLGPNSTCDVCLKCYTTRVNIAHAISCGHVFCQKCLDHLMQQKCPLCRERFSPRDIRKLHVDCDPSTIAAIDSPSEPVEGGKVNEIRRVIDECRAYYKSQPGNQVRLLLLFQIPDGIGLMSSLSPRKLVMQAEQLKYEDLERTSHDEKETALAIEKGLREHYDQMNSFWKGTMAPPPPPLQAVELQYFYRKEPKWSFSGSGDLTLSRVETAKGKVIDDKYDFHLSPLADVTAPLISTALSLMALGDDFDQDEIVKAKWAKSPGKAHVLSVKGLKVPIPQHATALTCTLNNGIHFVTTPETRLSSDARINQEFELYVNLCIPSMPTYVSPFKALSPPPAWAPLPPPPPLPKPKGGMFSFLSSSPKKTVVRSTPPLPPPAPPHKLLDNLARYLKQDGTLARALISFKDIAARCDVRLLEIKYPLIGQRSESSGGATTMELGEIVLQMFRLPSLPGVTSNQLPQSMDECLRSLRHNGGDCKTWRRRMFRVTGANLIVFNDVTKKAMATINLKKAIVVEDTQDAQLAALSPDG